LVEFTVEYRLVSGGSVIEERIFAGTPKEMVTMYHDQHGKLALTHYCILGTRVPLTEANRRVLVQYGLPIKERLAQVISIAKAETLAGLEPASEAKEVDLRQACTSKKLSRGQPES
jgi:hypothetical protein